MQEINKNLNITCAQLTRKSLDYLKQIKELEEDKGKVIAMVAQGYSKFEKMLVVGKDYGDRSGLGFNSSTPIPSSYQGEKSTFVKPKGKDHVSTQESKQNSSFQNDRKPPSRVFHPNKNKAHSQKSRNIGKNQYLSKGKTYDSYHDASSRHSCHASSSRP